MNSIAQTDPQRTEELQDKVGSRFELLRVLGEGAFGVVYEARDRSDGRRVALKALRDTRADWLEGFKAEFRALQDLRHPNLVALDELFSMQGRWFFTMELIDGGDLISALRHDDTQFDERLLRSAFRQLLEGLGVLHAAGKVHRDIKPSNVMVASDERTVLLDFGLVTETSLEAAREERFVVGTPAYMAPEQASVQGVGPAADLYAVGVMLFEALTGQLPYDGDPSTLLWSKCLTDAPSPAELARIPEDLASLASALLQRAPHARPCALEALAQLGADRSSSAPQWWSGFLPSWYPPAPLVGRVHELSQLRAAFEADSPGDSVVVHVSGPSGVGKTALVRAFVDQLRRDGSAVVLSSRCYERESVPFKAFDDLIDSIVNQLAQLPHTRRTPYYPASRDALTRMFPAIGVLESFVQPLQEDSCALPELRRQAFSALRELLERICDARPLVLWFDDMQWGDADSGALLTTLLRPPHAQKLCVLLSYRLPESRGPFLEALEQSQPEGVREARLTLGDLVSEEARELAHQLLDQRLADPSASVSLVVRESNGNPLFINVLVAYLAERGMPELSSADITLEAVIMSRVARLPASCRRILQIAAIAGGPISQHACATAAGLGEAFHEAIALLRAAQLIRTRGTRPSDLLMTYHDRIADTVATRLGSDEQRKLHLEIAVALEHSEDSDAEMLVEHYRAAGELSRAGDYAIEAARAAASSLAFDRAARLYRAALELRKPQGIEREQLETALADALANAGRGEAAAEVYLDTARRADGATALELRRRAGEQLLRSGHLDHGFDVIDDVLHAVGVLRPKTTLGNLISLVGNNALVRLRGLDFVPRAEQDIPPDELRRVDALWSAAVATGTFDILRGAEIQAQHILVALRSRDPYRISRALCLQAAHVAVSGHNARAQFADIVARLQRAAIETGRPHVLGLTELARGMGAWCFGDTRGARDHCTQAETVFRERCTGATWEMTTARIFANNALAMRGELAELRHFVSVDTQAARDRGDRYATWIGIAGLPVLGHLAADEPERARAELRDVREHCSKRVFTVQHHFCTVATTLIDLYTGREHDALERLPQEYRAHQAVHLLRVEIVRTLLQFLHASSVLASNSKDLTLPKRFARAIAADRSEWGAPISNLLQAAIAWQRGRRRKTVSLLRAAIAGFDAVEMRLFSAAAERRLGCVLGGDEGRTLIARGETFMREQAIRQPARMTRALAPGYPQFD